jgi:hypothetical protein
MADELTPPDPPNVIAARYATAAKKAVDAAAQVAIDAFDKVNNGPPGSPPPYQPKDALARVALQVQWDRRVLLVADDIASIVGTGLGDVLTVAEDVAQKVSTRSYGQQEWVNAAIRLTSIGALRGAEMIETAIAGPGPYANPLIRRTFGITPPQNNPATLAVTKLIRTADGTDIKALVTFDPPTAKLAANATEFTIVVNTAGLPSGVYQGAVTATDDSPPHTVRSVDITVLAPETLDPTEP